MLQNKPWNSMKNFSFKNVSSKKTNIIKSTTLCLNFGLWLNVKNKNSYLQIFTTNCVSY